MFPPLEARVALGESAADSLGCLLRLNTSDSQVLLESMLGRLGFSCSQYHYKAVPNLWATIGKRGPLLVFVGHTDVVPFGNLARWTQSPNGGNRVEQTIFGRGAVDMKGGIAAFYSAAEELLRRTPVADLPFRLGVLIAGDEETTATGTPYVLDQLASQGCVPDYCLVGEPVSRRKMLDTVKIGGRGSLTGKLAVHGFQSHSAYAVVNAIHRALSPLQALAGVACDGEDALWPATQVQLTKLATEDLPSNVVPERLDVTFNVRFRPELSRDEIVARLDTAIAAHISREQYVLSCSAGAKPFLSQRGKLLDLVQGAVQQCTGQMPEANCYGASSDGRFFVERGIEMVELGLMSDQLHVIDEHTTVDDLALLAEAYLRVLLGLQSMS